MKKNSLKLIFNDGAGNGQDPTAQLEKITAKLAQLGFRVNTSVSNRKRAYKIARMAAKKGYRLVVAAGGDGTIEAVARGLIGEKSRLGILPTGTYNNVAKSLGIPEDLDAACELLAAYPKRRVDVGVAKGSKKKTFFLEQVGVGLSAAIFPELEDLHKLNFERVTQALKTAITYQTPHFSLLLDGKERLETDSLLVTIANTPITGPNLEDMPGAVVDDGWLEIGFYPGFNKAQLAAYFTALMGGNKVEDERVQRYRARKVTVKAKPPQQVVADNIVIGKGKVTVRMARKALRVVARATGGLAQPGLDENAPVSLPANRAEDKYQKESDKPAVSLPVTGHHGEDEGSTEGSQ